MSDDETPTPKQSGSYAIMAGICADSRTALREWERELHGNILSPGAATQIRVIREFIRRFDELHTDISRWASTPPSATDKASTIDTVLELREKAQLYAIRFGRRI